MKSEKEKNKKDKRKKLEKKKKRALVSHIKYAETENKNNFEKNTNLSYQDYIEKNIIPDGNCFFRCISYYYRQTQDAHLEFRDLLYQWKKNNKDLFLE